MRVHFEVIGCDGAVVASGSQVTDIADAGSWTNLSEVKRLLRASGVVPGFGQRLVIWVQREPSGVVFPDEVVDRAVRAFHDALGTHLDDPAAAHSPAQDWIDGPVTAIVEALLISGWVPPGQPDDLEGLDLSVVPAPRTAS